MSETTCTNVILVCIAVILVAGFQQIKDAIKEKKK